ncbi:5'-3' exoribonuclease 1 [Camelus dromedarius]|uniref:5'-3' exoribonuclease 1 n=1 Tax=Camelus dromedarius TaxID=9838 RepID=A0A5N4EJK2_CAMDR|nr:5'-3' exoribonuclease 1 [Camelus dromedarius]
MGVPKFYRWISERYPCLSEVVKEHQIPEFDNLYLDMNGIIHQCSHPNDDDVHFRISDDKIFTDIFHYLEVLFRIIKPRKVFFMAVDGVAPRAKMNQQRGRRFRSAKEAEDKIKKAIEKGETLPTEARFDSNCITPGTEFMARLHEHLKYFVNMKISTDKSWQGVTIYFSGHETPGEGEHKIMEFIRSEKAKPDHDPNTRHCLYGLDADLDKITFKYDIERIIDDWILMGFLVGNDFIPHLPHLHINHDALPLLYGTYITILPELGGKKSYINESGHLNLPRFEKYLVKLSDFDREHFSEVFVDLKWFESKVGNKYLNEAAGVAAEEAKNYKEKKKSKGQENSLCWAALDKNGEVVTSKENLEDETEDDDLFETEFRQYKRTYYMTKMGVDIVSDDFLADQAACYVQAIQWILHYYYHGVQSWSWFYPYHYAPFLSDIRNISTLKIHFELGKPFKPFEQLLAVLPAASKNLLPTCYQHLMTSEDSPIIEYYPPDFKTDLNGKQQEWEAVVLIPFIDEKRLLEAMETCNHSLKKEERKRNQHSECLMCWYDSDTEFIYPSPWPEKFPAIEQCCARYKIISLDAWRVDISKNRITRVDQKALYFCGFPTLKHIRHKSVENIASSVLGKSVFVNWPHLEEARIVGVSDGETKFYLEEPPGTQKLYLGRTAPPSKVVHLGDKEQSNWTKEIQGISEYYLRRKGIIINETSAVIYGQLLTGRKYQINQNGEVRLQKQWSKQVLPFVYQTVVKDIRAFDSRFSNIKTLDDLFPPRSMVFMLGTPYYGCTGEVQDSGDVITEGRIRVVFSIPCEPNLDALIQNQHATKKVPHGDHKANVGLNLKFNKKNEEVPGYTKKVGSEWMYSSAAEQLLAEYLERAPELFCYIAKNSQEDVFYEDDIWPGENENGAEKVQEIITWLKGHPVSTLSRSSCDLQILDAAIVEKIEEEVEKCKQRKTNKKVRVTVKPHLLYRPLEQQHGVIPDRDAEFRLFDRVVNVRENFSVPVGLRGTIIGIKGANREADVLFEVLFDEEFPGGLTIRCSPGRGYRLPTSALVNLSHGSRSETGSQKLTAIVKPQPAVNHYSSNSSISSGHLGGLNHSPQSLFVPTQVPTKDDDEFCNIWQSLQGSRKAQHFQPTLQEKGAVLPQEISQVTQHHKSGFNDNSVKQRKHEPHRKFKEECKSPKTENQSQKMSNRQTFGGPAKCNIKLLKRSESAEVSENQNVVTGYPNTIDKPNPGIENFIASLNISKENEVQSSHYEELPSEEHLSPQSFAMKGTRMLKEILKIDSCNTVDHKNEMKQFGNEVTVSSNRRDEYGPSSQPKQNKKLTSYTNKPHCASEYHNVQSMDSVCWPASSQIPPVSTPVTELSRICSLVGMPQPNFSFLRTAQTMTVCQVKLSNGLLVHGPQCHSENEAKEKAAFFALQQLGSLGVNFPLPPPIFPSYPPAIPPGTIPPVFPQPTGWDHYGSNLALGAANIMPSSSHLFGSMPWGPPVPVPGKPFHHTSYTGTMSMAGGMPAGVHNQFIPLQVTKKRVANKKIFENKEAQSSQATPLQTSQSASSDVTKVIPQENSSVSLKSSQIAQPVSSFQVEAASPGHSTSHHKSTPSSSSRRKSRKLAVNFGVSKPSE